MRLVNKLALGVVLVSACAPLALSKPDWWDTDSDDGHTDPADHSDEPVDETDEAHTGPDTDAETDTEGVDTDPPTDSCTNECSPGPATCNGPDLLGCGEADTDACLDEVRTACPSTCFSGRCVECVLDEDCANPIEQACEGINNTCVARANYATTTVRYGSGSPRTFTDMYTANVTWRTSDGKLEVRLQQNQGFTIWGFVVDDDLGTGNHALSNLVTLTEADTSLSSSVRGTWISTSGTMQVSTWDMRRGGVIEGQVSATLTGPIGVGTGSGTISANFHVTIPP